MTQFIRRSPIAFSASVEHEENRGDWNVVLRYEGEGAGLKIVDFSNAVKWDIQDERLSIVHLLQIPIPETPGDCLLINGILVARVTPNRARVWHLFNADAEMPRQPPYTDVTDGFALLSLSGENLPSMMERLTRMDLTSVDRPLPYRTEGKIADVPCEAVVLESGRAGGTVLIACPRSYGRALADALMEVGSSFAIRPAGQLAVYDMIMRYEAGSPRLLEAGGA